MAVSSRHDAWQAGDRYEMYEGALEPPARAAFSRLARTRIWPRMPGCRLRNRGLSAAVLDRCNPVSLIGVDPSEGFVVTAKAQLPDRRAQFRVGDAQVLPLD